MFFIFFNQDSHLDEVYLFIPLPFLVDILGLYQRLELETISGPVGLHPSDGRSGLHVVGALLRDDLVQASGPVRPGLPPVGGDGTMV